MKEREDYWQDEYEETIGEKATPYVDYFETANLADIEHDIESIKASVLAAQHRYMKTLEEEK
tara:strand:- start:1159 stop:1344 length:186 start_codon:yes stop_codon:yes gene_type:complete